jgi:hypothetical protein
MLLFNGGHPYFSLQIDGVPGVFGIDTGDSSGITMFRPFYDAHRFPVEQPGQARLQAGIGGRGSALLTRVASVQLGRSVLNQPLVTLSFAARGMFSADDIAGNLGYQFLRNFVLTLDYEHRVGYFTQSEDFGNFAEYNRSGLSLNRSDDELLIAEKVNPDTPAARVGIQAGDRIIRMNGKDTEGVASEVFVRMLSDAAGSSIVMVISHQGPQREVTFSLEELLPAGGKMAPLGGPPLSRGDGRCVRLRGLQPGAHEEPDAQHSSDLVGLGRSVSERRSNASFGTLGSTRNHVACARKLWDNSNQLRNCSLTTIFQRPAVRISLSRDSPLCPKLRPSVSR